MRFNGLDLNLLVALDAMLKERSISRAAERMHLSQSAMSNALARLREYFDDELLVQVGRKLEPTARAEQLKEAVRDVLVRIDATVAAPSEFVPAESERVFRLLVSEFTTAVLIGELMRLASDAAPGVGFALLPQTNEPERLLSRGEADLLIIPSGYVAEDHPSQALFEESYTCVVWSGNSRIGATLSFDEYVASGHVAVEFGRERYPAFDGWFMQRYGVMRRVEVTTYSMTAPCALVVGTQRIATVHTRLAELAAKSMPLRLLPPPIDIPRLTQLMQWHKHKSRDPGLAWLRNLLVRAAQAMEGGAGMAAAASSPAAAAAPNAAATMAAADRTH